MIGRSVVPILKNNVPGAIQGANAIATKPRLAEESVTEDG